MIKNILKATLAGLAIILGIGAGALTSNESHAAYNERNTKGWNVKSPETMTVNGGTFTVKAYFSNDNKSAWIYNIKINDGESVKKLKIPATVKGKTVTKIGWVYVPRETDDEYDNEFNNTLFGSTVEQSHGCSGYTKKISKIESMTIPATVTEIQPSSFSGMKSLKSVRIPDGVECLPYQLFYGCTSLQKVKLPASMKELSPNAFADCYKINKMTISSANKNYKITNKCVVTKKDKKLVFCYGSGTTYKIPKGIRILGSHSFDTCTAKTVHIPASVNQIEAVAFSMGGDYSKRYVQDVTIDEENMVYARDGQTIYNKNDNSLSVAIITGKKSESVFRMSNNVEKLTNNQNYVSPDKILYGVNTVYLSENLKEVGYLGWGIAQNTNNLYYTSRELPEIKKTMEGYAHLPIFCNLYVPESALDDYKSLYEKYDELSCAGSWNTY